VLALLQALIRQPRVAASLSLELRYLMSGATPHPCERPSIDHVARARNASSYCCGILRSQAPPFATADPRWSVGWLSRRSSATFL